MTDHTKGFWIKLREKRNCLLQESDHYAVIDFPHESYGSKEEWVVYRDNLRNITKNITPEMAFNGNIDDIVWPEKPPLPSGDVRISSVHDDLKILGRIAQENAVLRDDNVRMKTRLTRLERKSTELEKSIIELRKQLDATVNT